MLHAHTSGLSLDPTVTLGSMTVGITPYLRNLSLRLSRIAASSSDPKSASEIIKICNELVDKIEVLEKVFKVLSASNERKFSNQCSFWRCCKGILLGCADLKAMDACLAYPPISEATIQPAPVTAMMQAKMNARDFKASNVNRIAMSPY